MDQELAYAVLQRWQSGDPVYEGALYKAAQALGADPDDALLEARFFTVLNHDLHKLAEDPKARLDDSSLELYAAAAGLDGRRPIEKTASAYFLEPHELIFQKLAEQGWVIDLGRIKQAMMGADPAMAGGAEQEGQMPPPQQGAVVQQPKFKPTPMAPAQEPPSDEGNLGQLAQEAQFPEPMGGPGGGGAEAGGAPQGGDESQVPGPEEKIQQVAPDLPQDMQQRYAQKLSELEQEVGMPVTDPKQVQKFVEQMKKQDQKVIDEKIKEMGSSQTGPDSFAPAGAGQQQQQPPQGGGEDPSASEEGPAQEPVQ